ncbi:hypothetical protein DFH06DRAFT_1059126 [Mycena polygramma]|nr:hypothetical protein DFH06DRAFT_1059126 [Mycena polygramma]
MPLEALGSRLDPEKNDPPPDKRSTRTRLFAWISRPLDPKKNDAKNDQESILTRIYKQIFPEKSETSQPPNPATKPPRQRREEQPPYSEAESRQASAKLWSIYIAEAERYDKALVESWKADMEGMLIFSGLFSASLTAFLIESYQTLQPDSGAVTVQLLNQISQQLAAPSINPSLASLDGSEFRPTASSLVCNTLWFISLTLSITCALLATLVEQWAREFLHRTEKHPSPIRRARVFSFLYFGLRRFGMHVVVDLIPLLLHVSLILFLAGLIAFLVPINEFMVGLISAILAIFLAIYAVMTLLPVLSTDCPYRTPFSGFAWRIIQEARKRWPGSASPTAAKFDDAMLDMALQSTERRDQCALIWTLDSLTDDTELLPFVEAIPDAIYGPKGFHMLNDHLFIPLLDGPSGQRSLDERITDILLSSRNMAAENPLRQRSIIAALKAIWALGMISDRTGTLFGFGKRVWFARAVEEQVSRARLRAREEDSSSPLETVAYVAMCYSNTNTLRKYIAHVAEIADGEEEDLNLPNAVKDIMKRARHLHPANLPDALRSRLEILRAWSVNPRPNTISEVRLILREILRHTSLWLDENVRFACSLIRGAAYCTWKGWGLPQGFVHTCNKIVPEVPPLAHIRGPDKIVSRSFVFHGSNHWFDPTTGGPPSATVSDLDVIMSCLFRILPLLRPDDVMVILAVYLAKRDYPGAIQVATQHCPLEYLMDCLVGTFIKISSSDNDPALGKNDTTVLQAISAIMSHSSFRKYIREWWPRDKRLYDLMAAKDIFESPGFLCLSTLMRLRKLRHLLDIALNQLDDSWTPEDMDVAPGAEELRIMISDSLLSIGCEDAAPPENATAEALRTAICVRASRASILYKTKFILACTQEPDQPYLSGTMHAIARCVFKPLVADDDAKIMISFAEAWLKLVKHVIMTPQGELLLTADFLLTGNDAPGVYYHPAAAPIFKDAIILYLDFLLRAPGENSNSIFLMNDCLDRLNARMTKDGP